MKESFEVLYVELAEGPRMMLIGLHPRMAGRPGRVRAIKQFIAFAKQYGDVWFPAREEIARAWLNELDGLPNDHFWPIAFCPGGRQATLIFNKIARFALSLFNCHDNKISPLTERSALPIR
ncbi:hypothetical protein ASE98_02215 [Pseudomonas sp. Leaf48]|uniref:hypothetical protein n=1 Tax=Pseudomonas sp. Leaf48 TaxID=1736221 RepID=UPI00072B1210|nr:hypothetical protein [Pseudomonas sp. Leaf48]KQN50658.1 hypothetical protein ASE98_02215 [Pseudomonas sp. Leaf48]